MEVVAQKVDLLLGQNRFAEARGMLMQKLAESPEHPMLNALLGYCLSLEDRGAEALRPASYAASCAPDWPLTHFVLAHVYFGMDKTKDALAAIDQAIALDPAEPDYHGLKARILFVQQKWHDAVASAEEGLKFDPDHEQCRHILTATKNQLGQHEEVEHLVDEALRKDPENALAFANKGWSCLRQGQPKEAVRHFKEALRLKPELEYARLGCLEALKAHNPAYRWFLAYTFMMGSLSGRAQFAIIIGLFIVYRLIRSMALLHPGLRAFTTPLMVAYLAFAYVSWVGPRLSDCLLLFHPFGRLAMTKTEKQNAGVLGGTLLSGIVLTACGAYMSISLLIVTGILLVAVTIPLVGALNADTLRARRIARGMLAAILVTGLLGVFVAPGLFSIAIVLWIIYLWAVGQYVSRN